MTMPALEQTSEKEMKKQNDHAHRQTSKEQKQTVPYQRPQQAMSYQFPQQEYSVNHHNNPEFAAQHLSAATMDTTLLGNNTDDTVLLEDDVNFPDNQAQNNLMPILLREREDRQSDTIKIDGSHFLIGRHAESVNYTEYALGVSRIHAEIIRIDPSNYGIKDLGSKNGSKLNGNTMVPYKMYALQEDDEIVLGKATYTFTWSTTQ